MIAMQMQRGSAEGRYLGICHGFAIHTNHKPTERHKKFQVMMGACSLQGIVSYCAPKCNNLKFEEGKRKHKSSTHVYATPDKNEKPGDGRTGQGWSVCSPSNSILTGWTYMHVPLAFTTTKRIKTLRGRYAQVHEWGLNPNVSFY